MSCLQWDRVVDARSEDLPIRPSEGCSTKQLSSELDTAIEARHAELDRLGVAIQVLNAPANARLASSLEKEQLRSWNQTLLSTVRTSGGRLRALALLDTNDGAFGANAFQGLLDEGFWGASVPTSVEGKRLDEPEFRPLLSLAAKHKKPLFVYSDGLHNGGPVIGERQQAHVGVPADIAICLSRLLFRGVFEEYPDLRIYLDQGGGASPSLIARWDHGYAVRRECRDLIPHPPSFYLKNVYFDAGTLDASTLDATVKSVGERQVVFASSALSLVNELTRVQMMLGDSDGQNQAWLFSCGNAANLYGGDKSL